MNVTPMLSDDAILAEIGDRAGAARISRDLTQAELARDAGISKRTVERLESGESVQLTSFVRVLRALDLLAGFDTLLPPARPTPMDLLRGRGKAPKRASGERGGRGPEPTDPQGERDPGWTWGEDA